LRKGVRRDAQQAKGKAEAIVALLTARGLAPDEALRGRILGCADVAALERWLLRAVTARSADEVVEAP